MMNNELIPRQTAIMRSQHKNARGKFFLQHWDLNHGPHGTKNQRATNELCLTPVHAKKNLVGLNG